MLWDETDNYIHSGHKNLDDYDQDSMKTIEIDSDIGIKAIVSCPKVKFKDEKCEVGTEVKLLVCQRSRMDLRQSQKNG